jgi:spore coat protein A
LLGSAERPDVLVDFSSVATYPTEIILYNDCPAPFPGGDVRNDYFPGLANGNPVNLAGLPSDLKLARNTRCIMKFRVTGGPSTGESTLTLTTSTDLSARVAPNKWNQEPQLIKVSTSLTPVASGDYALTGWGADGATITTSVWNGTTYAPKTTTINKWKNMSLNETFDDYGRLEQRLGPLSAAPTGLTYLAPLQSVDYVTNLQTELWAIYNTTADVHPMHLHMSNWQVVGRQAFSGTAPALSPTGTMRGALPDETGFKETVKCWPGEIVYIIALWDIPQVDGPSTALFDPPTSPRPALAGYDETVWHCHILEHEEHDMMRPLAITIAAFAVPNVVGMTFAAATAAITGLGLVANITGNTAGVVSSQSPLFGNRARAGQTMNAVMV